MLTEEDQEECKKLFEAPVYCISKDGDDETGRAFKEGEKIYETPPFKTMQAAIDKSIEDRNTEDIRIIII